MAIPNSRPAPGTYKFTVRSAEQAVAGLERDKRYLTDTY